MIHFLWASLLIPIIIHLVYRRKAKPMPFSTLHFLRMIDQRVRRRHRLKELLLLLLRLMLLAALVGALEKPKLRSGDLGGGLPTTAAILLDNTYSMQAAHQGASAFARARDAALRIIDGLKGQDSAVLIPFDSHEDEALQPTAELARLRGHVSQMQCGYGTGGLAAALQRALESLQKSDDLHKEIYIITDMQKLCWPSEPLELPDEASQELKNASVFLTDVGRDVAENLTVKHADFGLRMNVRGAVSNLYCEVENTGPRSAGGTLSLVLQDNKIAQQDVPPMAPGAVRTVIFSHVFDQGGVYHGCVELGADSLPADNRHYFTVTVHDKLPVLVVNGQESVNPYRDGAFYLKLALGPGSLGGRVLSPIDARVVSHTQFLSERLEDYGCVIMVNVPRIGNQWAGRLASYVQGGGGLLIFCGSNVEASSYNAALGGGMEGHLQRLDESGQPLEDTGEGSRDVPRLLPADLGEVKSSVGDEDAYFAVLNADVRHPILRDIHRETNLGTLRVKRFFGVDTSPGHGGGVTLIELDDGPLFIEDKLGAGTVMLCTSTCTPDWNNMPLKPYFLPLLHQMVYYLGGAGDEQTPTPVGTALRVKVLETSEPAEVSVYPPPESDDARGKKPQAKLVNSSSDGGENVAVFYETDRPGIYRAELPSGGILERQLFAVNVPPKESQLDRLPPQEAAGLVGLKNVTVVDDADRLEAIVRRERQGLPLWDYLLLATIIVAVCESLVANVHLKH